MNRISDKVTLFAGLTTGLAAGGVVRKAILKVLRDDDGKNYVSDTIGASIISAIITGIVGTETMKVIDSVNRKIDQLNTIDENTAEETEPTEEVAEES